MIEKLVVLTFSTFNKRDYQRYGIDILKSNNFSVEVWDITPVVYPRRVSEYIPHDALDRFNCPELSVLENKKDFFDKLANLGREACFICLLKLDAETLFIFKELSRKGLKYLLSNCNIPPPVTSWTQSHIPESKENRGVFLQWKKRLNNIHSRIMGILLYRFPVNLFSFAPPLYLLVGGTKSDYKSAFFRRSERIWAHSYDFDRYLELEHAEDSLPLKNWAVFLDHGTPYQPDVLSYGKERIPPEKYYPILLAFFDRIEKDTGLEVVIAAHPRWDYQKAPDHFKGRKILRGQTVRLVKESKLVIGIFSTALTFAAVYRKPVFFLRTGVHLPEIVQSVATAFGKRVHCHPNEEIDWEEEFSVNNAVYSRYLDSYIKKQGTPNLPLWQIVADRLKQEI
jgi:hypothetical protein